MRLFLKEIVQKGTWDPHDEEYFYGPYYSICEEVRNTLIKLANHFPDSIYSFDDECVEDPDIRILSDGRVQLLITKEYDLDDYLKEIL